MIAIKNDQGLFLELFSNQNLVTEQVAAWLVDDELPGEFSYPIDAPLTENNQRFVQYGYRPDSAQPRRLMPVTVQLGGVLYRRCQLAYRLQNGKLNAYLKIDSAEAYDKLRKINLLEALPNPVPLGNGLRTVNGVSRAITLNERLNEIATLPPSSFPAAFFPIRNELFFEDDLPTKLPGALLQPYVNAWARTGTSAPGFVVDTGTVRGYPICPQLYLWWVLEQLMLLAGFRIESDWLARPQIQQLCILNMTAMRTSTGSLLTNLTALTGHSFVPGLCLPDMSVSDFLKAIKQRFGLVFTFNANTRICTISQFLGTVASGPAVDMTPYQSGPYDTAEPDGRGYAVSEFIDSSDMLYKDAKGETIQPDPLLIGNGGQPVSMKAGSCQSIYTASGLSTAGRWQVPTVRQPGNVVDIAYQASDRYLDQSGRRRNSIGLRLVSYEGMQPDSTGVAYPFASSETTDLAGRRGLWRNGLRQFYYFRDQTQRITQPLHLPATVLSTLALHRTVSLTLHDQIRRSYLPTKLQAETPGPAGLLTGRLECQTLPAGIDQPADIDEPIVWLELLIETKTVLGPMNATVTTNTYNESKLTVNVWADRQKTRPALVSSLPIWVRQLQTWPRYAEQKENKLARTTFYQETRRSYTLLGPSTVIEPALRTRLTLTGVNALWEQYDMIVQLDPGDGYRII